MLVEVKKPDGRGKWIRTPKKKACKKCGEDDPLKMHSNFDKRVGKKFILNLCRKCHNLNCSEWEKKNPEIRKLNQKLQNEKGKIRRKAGINVDKYIYQDCRNSDRKHGRENDMTREFIREQIDKGCTYCGATDLRMTIDRIDNAIGHVKTNVVPACIRCNYFRRNMPYEAWLVVAEGVKDTRLKGLFEDWTGRARTCD